MSKNIDALKNNQSDLISDIKDIDFRIINLKTHIQTMEITVIECKNDVDDEKDPKIRSFKHQRLTGYVDLLTKLHAEVTKLMDLKFKYRSQQFDQKIKYTKFELEEMSNKPEFDYADDNSLDVDFTDSEQILNTFGDDKYGL